uniref:Uncharacterized protein n=1 Tax=Timema cristinae TaxID=61476 RepID=A0A7R9D7R3_TIMCR|nr:unnamed protein product [Timema cristinae]
MERHPTQCTQQTCLGSLVALPGRPASGPRSQDEVLVHAKDFLEQYFTSIRRVSFVDDMTPVFRRSWYYLHNKRRPLGRYGLIAS